MTTTTPVAAKPLQTDRLVDPTDTKKFTMSEKWFRWVNFVDAAIRRTAGAAATVFIDLADVPSTYTAQGGKYVRVNAGATALEFKDLTAPSYTVAGAPATPAAGRLAYISNEAGGAVLAFGDGAAWRRVTDRAIIS